LPWQLPWFFDILDSIFEFADPKKPYYLCEKVHDFLPRTEIGAILAFFQNLLAKTTPLAPLKF